MSNALFNGLGIETLESRTMMAGDVGAALAGGDLVLNGDNNSNEVAIRATDQAGEFIVEGLNGTTINGQASTTIQGVNDDFRINLRNGDNILMLTAEGPNGEQPDLVVPDDLQIRTGSGNDIVVFDNVRVGDRTSVNTSDGNDTLVTFETRLGDSFLVNMGDGDDFLGLDSTQVDGRLRASMGNGNDDLVGFNSNFLDRFDANMGSGDDLVGFVDSNLVEGSRVNGGNGFDQLLTADSDVEGLTNLRGIEVTENVESQDVSDEISDNGSVLEAINLIFTVGTGF